MSSCSLRYQASSTSIPEIIMRRILMKSSYERLTRNSPLTVETSTMRLIKSNGGRYFTMPPAGRGIVLIEQYDGPGKLTARRSPGNPLLPIDVEIPLPLRGPVPHGIPDTWVGDLE